MAAITNRNTISVWFECNSCQLTFPFRTVNEFLDHKEQKHLTEFHKIRCIVFEERKQDELFTNSDENIEKLFSEDDSNGDVELCSIEGNPQPEPILPPANFDRNYSVIPSTETVALKEKPLLQEYELNTDFGLFSLRSSSWPSDNNSDDDVVELEDSQNQNDITNVASQAQAVQIDTQGEIKSTANIAPRNVGPAFGFVDVDATVDDLNQIVFDEPRDSETINNTFKTIADSPPPKNPFVLLQRLTVEELLPFSKIIVSSNQKAKLKTKTKLNTSKPSTQTKGAKKGTFICPICRKSIKTKGALGRHMQSHCGMESGPKPFKCPYPDCQCNFTTKSGLYQHKKRHENPSCNPKSTMDNPFFKFPSPESDTGLNQADDPLTFREWLIEQKLSEKSDLSDPDVGVNIIRLDPDPTELDGTGDEAFKISRETPIKCKLCRKNLKSEAEVKVHVTHCWLRNKLRHCYCLPCTKTLSGPLSLRNHNNVFHSGRQLQRTVQVHSCHLCPRTFNGVSQIKQHLDAHTRKQERALQPFVCEICGKTFTEIYVLKCHQLCHTEARPFKCPRPNCEKAFKTQYALSKHAENHTEAKLFTCPKEGCSKRFKTRNVLLSHLKTHRHTGVFQPNSWKCDQENCGKLYVHKIALDRHMIAAHGIGGQLPTFECEICSKTFTWKVLYTLHVRGHTQMISFKCHYEGCEKAYKKKCTLVDHIHVNHTGERPFQCDLCGKAYHRRTGLKWHIGVHKKSKLKELN